MCILINIIFTSKVKQLLWHYLCIASLQSNEKKSMNLNIQGIEKKISLSRKAGPRLIFIFRTG